MPRAGCGSLPTTAASKQKRKKTERGCLRISPTKPRWSAPSAPTRTSPPSRSWCGSSATRGPSPTTAAASTSTWRRRPFDARTLRNLANIFYSKEDLLFAALQGAGPRRWAYCKPTDERFIQELNRKRPQTMRAFQKIWYGGEDGSDLHYHQSRYHALNLHSVFSHGTAGVPPVQLHRGARWEDQGGHPAVPGCVCPSPNSTGRQPHQDPDHQPGLHLPHLAAASGHDWGRVRHRPEAPAGKPGGQSRLAGPRPGGAPAGDGCARPPWNACPSRKNIHQDHAEPDEEQDGDQGFTMQM